MQENYQTLLTQFLVENPQYTPRGSEPFNQRVDFYIWGLVNGGLEPNEYFFWCWIFDRQLEKKR